MYALGIQNLPLDNLKFLDETHFVLSHFLKDNYFSCFVKNCRTLCMGTNWKALKSYFAASLGSFSMTALLGLNSMRSIILDLSETNTQVSYLSWILHEFMGLMQSGICFFGFLQSKNVWLVWLPKYSQEFNSVELFWWYLKGQIWNLPKFQDFVNLQHLVVNITAGWYLNQCNFWLDFGSYCKMAGKII